MEHLSTLYLSIIQWSFPISFILGLIAWFLPTKELIKPSVNQTKSIFFSLSSCIISLFFQSMYESQLVIQGALLI